MISSYPEVSLKEARARRDETSIQLTRGINPSFIRKTEKNSLKETETNNFEVISREWHGLNSKKWESRYGQRVLIRLEKYIFPYLKRKSIQKITSSEILETLRRIERNKTYSTAHRVCSIINQIFIYAIVSNKTDTNPARDLSMALRPVQTTHLPAITKPEEVGRLLRMIDGYQGSPVVSTALKLAPLIFVRPGELRKAEWKDTDFKTKEWRFTVSKTKTPHIVPLSHYTP
jgi:integrase